MNLTSHFYNKKPVHIKTRKIKKTDITLEPSPRYKITFKKIASSIQNSIHGTCSGKCKMPILPSQNFYKRWRSLHLDITTKQCKKFKKLNKLSSSANSPALFTGPGKIKMVGKTKYQNQTINMGSINFN